MKDAFRWHVGRGWGGSDIILEGFSEGGKKKVRIYGCLYPKA